MKVLLINNFFTKYGGAENSVYQTANILKKHGHIVHFFATNKKPYMDEDYEFASCFPEYVNYSSLNWFDKCKKITKPIYNFEAEKKLDLLIKKIKPDVAHINCISFGLTPSVLNACYKNNLAVVMTVREPYLICPSITLRKNASEYCKDKLCLDLNPLHCIQNKCFEKSYTKSTIAAIEFMLRKYTKIFDGISYYICATPATKNLVLESGVKENKIILINNFLKDYYLEDKPNYTNQGYFLYVGRISMEKGIHFILEAMADMNNSFTLHIVGNGPEEEPLKNLAKRLNLSNVIFQGYKAGKELEYEYKNCIASILPCNWFETFGLTIIESFAYGKPVIGSNIGGIPGVIDHNRNGILFEPGNVKELKSAMEKLLKDNCMVTEMGKNARNKAETMFNSDVYYNKLTKVYIDAIQSRL